VENLQDIKAGKEYKDFFEVVKPLLDKVDGITLSGGEPLFQANELLKFLNKLPKNLDKMLFTGFYKNELNDIQLKCFNMFDLVVEGRFEKEKMGNFLYRGSSNQVFSSPTGKYRDILDILYTLPSAGIEVEVRDNKFYFYGIPTKNNEIEKIKKSLINKGIKLL
jgi:anaerobic ribonucleoside-triphosphate reductase activating protein